MKIIRRIIAAAAMLAVLLSPFSAFALDETCLTSRTFFSDSDKTILIEDNDSLNGTANYIVDEDNGCFYFSMKFIDRLMTDEQIHFRFIIRNSAYNITADINDSGLSENSSSEITSKINAVSKFKIVQREKSGYVVIAFELKDKLARTLTNYISCDYYCGDMRLVNVFSDVMFDMYVEPPETTTKAATSKSKTTNAKTTKPKDSDGTKTTRAKTTKETSTKFVPSKYTGTTVIGVGSTASKPQTSKFSTSADESASLSDEEFWSEALGTTENEAAVTEKASNSNVVNKTTSGRDRLITEKLAVIIGAVLIIVGLVVVTFGFIKKKKDKVKNKAEEEISDNSED